MVLTNALLVQKYGPNLYLFVLSGNFKVVSVLVISAYYCYQEYMINN